MPYIIELENGLTEEIPSGIHPVRRNSTWSATSTTATVEEVASALAFAERETRDAIKRRDFLRKLMTLALEPVPDPEDDADTTKADHTEKVEA